MHSTSILGRLGKSPTVGLRALSVPLFSPLATIFPQLRSYSCGSYINAVSKRQRVSQFQFCAIGKIFRGSRMLSSATDKREKQLANIHKRRSEKVRIGESLSEWRANVDVTQYEEYGIYDSTSGNLGSHRRRKEDRNIIEEKGEKEPKLNPKTWNKFFSELDPTTRYDIEGSSENSQKAQAISRTRRLTGHLQENTAKFGKPMTHRQQRAADELFGELSSLFYRREFHSLDLAISKALGDPMGGAIEVVDVRLTRDLQIVTVYWEPPLLPDGYELSEESILMIEEELQHIKGKLRTAVARRLGFRRAPQIKIARGFSSSDRDSKRLDRLFFDTRDTET